jgi:hypothetical protein
VSRSDGGVELSESIIYNQNEKALQKCGAFLTELENNMTVSNNDDNVKFCVTAYVDLLGFSNHLEIGADLRTMIGEEATKRLDNIERVIKKFREEKIRCRDFYPNDLHYKRINDCLILNMDLNDFLKPSIGQITKEDYNFEDLITEFDEQLDLGTRLIDKIIKCSEDLSLFVGLVSRIHNFINKSEIQINFPGAKTVISTGFRRKNNFLDGGEDFLAANFSFSNAYVAESKLHGPKFYVDNYILKLLSYDRYSRNLVKLSVFISKPAHFDPFNESNEFLDTRTDKEISKIESITLFRKAYFFREINTFISPAFQVTPSFSNYIRKNPNHDTALKGPIRSMYDLLRKDKVDLEEAKNARAFFNDSFGTDVDLLSNYLIYGFLRMK